MSEPRGTGDRSSRRTTGAVLGALLLGLAAANIARSTVLPDGADFLFNLALAAGTVATGIRLAGLRVDELGLSRTNVGAGLRWGGAAMALVAVVAGVAAAFGPGRDALDVDDARVTAAALAWRVLVVIPIGTVLVEELIFRGVIHGLLCRLLPTVRAVAAGAFVFGLWHVFPATRGDGSALLGLGTLAATTIAGLVFGILRVRSDSLGAPSLAHLATNTIPLIVAWLVHSA